MMYGSEAPPLSVELQPLIEANRKLCRAAVFARMDSQCISLLEAQYKLASQFVGLLAGAGFHGHGEIVRVLFNAFHSNLFHFWSSLELTKCGLFGSARPIFRLIYEGLLVSKFCAIADSTELYQRWDRGDPNLSVGRDVLKKISSPAVPELKFFWSGLCSGAHFSVYAGQPSLEPEFTADKIGHNYSFLLMLLAMNSHLLASQFLDRNLAYYLQRIDKDWSKHRVNMRNITREVVSTFTKGGKQAVREYSSKWVLRQ